MGYYFEVFSPGVPGEGAFLLLRLQGQGDNGEVPVAGRAFVDEGKTRLVRCGGQNCVSAPG